MKTTRILIIQQSSETIEATREKIAQLENHGVISILTTVGAYDMVEDLVSLPDLILLDVENDTSIEKMKKISAGLKANALTGIIPIAVLSQPSLFRHFDVAANFDSRLAADTLARRIRQVVRLSSMEIEYQRRLETAESFGIKGPLVNDVRELAPSSIRTLYLGKGERYFKLAAVFEGSAILHRVENFIDAATYLRDNQIDCFVVDTVSYPLFCQSELEALKENSRFFNLPTIVLQEGLDVDEQKEVIDGGLCDLFDLFDDATEIASHVRTVVKSEYLRKSLLDAFSSPGLAKLNDKSTGLPTGVFFERHLAKLTAQSKAWNLPIAFGILSVTTTVSDARSSELNEAVGRMIGSLIRVEDICTEIGNGKFVIAAPNSTTHSISRLIKRIRAVLESTQLAEGDEAGRVRVKSDFFISKPQNTPKDVMQKLKSA